MYCVLFLNGNTSQIKNISVFTNVTCLTRLIPKHLAEVTLLPTLLVKYINI